MKKLTPKQKVRLRARAKAREMLPEWRQTIRTLTFLKTVTGVSSIGCNALLKKYHAKITKAKNLLKS